MPASASLLLGRRAFLGAVAVLASPELRAEPESRARRLRRLLEAELAGLERWVQGFSGSLGAAFIDVESGAELAAHAPERLLNPASNQKLVTAAAVLDELGPDFRFETTLIGRVEGGKIPRLTLVGEGDPSLSRAHLDRLARELKARGTREVLEIAVDQSAFDDHFVPPAFDQQPHEWAAFRAPVCAVAVDRNTVLVGIEPSEPGSPARVSFDPPGFVDVEGSIATGARGTRTRPHAGLLPNGDRLSARLSGTIAAGSSPFRYRQRVDDPRLLAGYALKAALGEAGITVRGTVHPGGRDGELLARHRSEPLAELLHEVGKDSDNFYAEMLLKVLGARVTGRAGSSEAGAAAAVARLEASGAWERGMKITNGSGLFDANRLTARALARLLTHVTRDPKLREPFLAQLAIGGVDGTLARRFTKHRETRAVRAKTGTLSDVITLSGVVLDAGGTEPVAFSLLLNGVRGRTAAARQRIDRVVERLAGELWPSQEPAGAKDLPVGG